MYIHTIIPLLDLTLPQIFCINSSLLLFAFFLAEPVTEYLATLPPICNKKKKNK